MFEGIHHIVLFCKDTEQSKIWYEQAGFTYKQGYEGMYWFTFGGVEIMLHPIDQADPGRTEIHIAVAHAQDVFTYLSERGFELTDHQQSGKKIEGPVTRPWGDVEFELTDPDGHRWAFTEKS